MQLHPSAFLRIWPTAGFWDASGTLESGEMLGSRLWKPTYCNWGTRPLDLILLTGKQSFFLGQPSTKSL